MNYAHGVKRSGSYSRDDENHKISKYKHGGLNCSKNDMSTAPNNINVSSKNANSQSQPTSMACNDTIYQTGVSFNNLTHSTNQNNNGFKSIT